MRHVRAGKAGVARQREISVLLSQCGSLRSQEQAALLPTTFETRLRQQQQHLADEQRQH
jgi:hypothetical protein